MEFCLLNEEEFRNFLDKSPEKTFLQTPEIGKLREKSGWKVHFLGVKIKKEIVAAAMFVSINRYFGYKEFYSPRGLLLDYNNKELLAFFTKNIKEYVKKNKGYLFTIDPYIINKQRDSNGNIVSGGIDNSNINSFLLSLGYKQVKENDYKQVKWMYVLDVEGKTEDEILKNMKQNTRNTIRKTLKNGIEIVELNREQLTDFYKIMIETGERKGFSIRNIEYYQNMYDLFNPRGEIKYLLTRLDLNKHIKLLEDEKQEKIIEKERIKDNNKKATIDLDIETLEKRINYAKELINKHGKIINLSSSMFMMTYPEVVYLSSGNYVEFMSFNSQYLIQWEMIKYAIEHGYKRYNFYGISGNFDRKDKKFGIYGFKTGFNGVVEELIGEYSYKTSSMYYVIKIIEKLKSIFKKKKKY